MPSLKQASEVLAEIRAAALSVDEAIQLAARVAERNQRGRGDFLQRAAELWDEEFETEEAKARKHAERKAAWTQLMADLNTPERIAERQARKEAEQKADEAARAARGYPVLISSETPGVAAMVHDDGRVELGSPHRAIGASDDKPVFVPYAGEVGRVVRLEQTCPACPEQYDAFIGAQRVGYLRLRHGHFRADYPDVDGQTVLTGCPMGHGCFEANERPAWLDRARAALYEAWHGDWSDASDEDIEAEVARQHKADAEEDAERRASLKAAGIDLP